MKQRLVSLFIVFFTLQALAQFGSVFAKRHIPFLTFTTTAQTLYSGVCSSPISITNKNWLGTTQNVSGTLVISLSSTGPVTLYSDAGCTTTTTSVSIPNGNSGVSFYALQTGTGAVTVTATASAYASIVQNETASATNPFIWTGGGANANFSTGANWSGLTAPGSSDVAVFDGSCATNCSPTISTSLNVGGIQMRSGYAGTLTQATGASITVSTSRGWSMAAGTFNGSASSIIINSGSFSLSGGTFNNTTGTFSIPNQSYNLTIAGGTFNSSAGTIAFGGGIFTPGSGTYKNITFTSGAPSSVSGTLNMTGLLTLGNGNGNPINGGTIATTGDVTIVSNGSSGSTLIRLIGTADQTVSASTATDGVMPSLEIASGGGTVHLAGTIGFGNIRGASDIFKFTSGTLDAGSSTLRFGGNGMSETATFGTPTYNNISFVPSGGSGLTVHIQDSVHTTSMTIGGGAGGESISMPNPGNAYSMTVDGTLTMTNSLTNLYLYNATLTYGMLNQTGGTIHP